MMKSAIRAHAHGAPPLPSPLSPLLPLFLSLSVSLKHTTLSPSLSLTHTHNMKHATELAKSPTRAYVRCRQKQHKSIHKSHKSHNYEHFVTPLINKQAQSTESRSTPNSPSLIPDFVSEACLKGLSSHT